MKRAAPKSTPSIPPAPRKEKGYSSILGGFKPQEVWPPKTLRVDVAEVHSKDSKCFDLIKGLSSRIDFNDNRRKDECKQLFVELGALKNAIHAQERALTEALGKLEAATSRLGTEGTAYAWLCQLRDLYGLPRCLPKAEADAMRHRGPRPGGDVRSNYDLFPPKPVPGFERSITYG